MTLIRIVKVGGSLLGWPGLRDGLRAWLASQPAGENILICGGGALADVIRRADREFALGEEAAHWLCIDLLSVTARVLAVMLRNVPLVETYDELAAQIAAGEGGTVVFDPREFLREREASFPGRPLPHGWNVTSDSIAGRLAEVMGATEVILLKSAEPTSASLAELAAAGYLDRHFPALSLGGVDVRMVNLRAAGD
jgi:5-(aminomethyl)-3-furanmethanol phosphate kinase